MARITVVSLYLLSTLTCDALSEPECGDADFADDRCIKRAADEEPAALVQGHVRMRAKENGTSLQLLHAFAPYKGSALISATPVSREQFEVVKNLAMGYEGVDAWTERIGLHLPVHLMVAQDNLPTVKTLLWDAGMEPEVMIADIAQKLQSDHELNFLQVNKGIVGSYPRLDELYEWYDSIASKYSFVSILSIGKTHEQRDIKLVKIARHQGLPVVLVECGTHGREWIAVASCVWAINELLTSSDPSIQDLAHNIEFQIIPSHNPDGYEWTHVGKRLWRKNRNPNGGHRCIGVDLNRNWDSRWGRENSYHDECESQYCGVKPFSEPETRALSEHMLSERDQIKAFIEFHSYGQHVLMPPGSGPKPPDFDEFKKVGEEAAQKMEQIAGHTYDAGGSADVLYAYGGGSADWAHDSVKGPGIKYAYVVELRPSSYSEVGFQLPVRDIPEASREAFAGLKHVAQVVMMENSGARETMP